MKNNRPIFPHTTLVFTLLFFIGINSFAQSEKKTLKQARKYLDDEKYELAQEKYKELLSINPTNDVYNFEAGIAYFFPLQQRTKSISYFENALKNSTEDTIPELYYYLARAYHYNNEYDKSYKAFQNFKPFINEKSTAGRNLIKETDYFIERNQNGEFFLTNINEDVEITNLGNIINSEYGEYAPIFKPNENVLIFTSRRKTDDNKIAPDTKPYENIYAAKLNNNNWEIITDKNELLKHLPENYNSKKHNAGIIYSSDGKRLYLYKEDKIWQSNLKDNNWTELKKLEKSINSSIYNIPSISISADNKQLFFVALRSDGLGGKDIYKATLNDQGEWSNVINLGDKINTRYDEDSPYLSEDGKNLYFSSRGHKGMGGFDIFKCELVNGEWSEPKNLGIPYNSPADDIFFIPQSETAGFFASSRKHGFGEMDIYGYAPKKNEQEFIVEGNLTNNNNSPINKGTLSLTNSGETIAVNIDENGNYSLTQQNAGETKLTIENDAYKKQSVSFNIPDGANKSNIKTKLYQEQINTKTYQYLTVSSEELNLNITDTLLVVDDALAQNNEDTTTNNENNTNNTNEDINNKPVLKSYKELFTYKNTSINTNKNEFSTLINAAKEQLKTNDKIYINIEASASTVPVSTYSSNKALAIARLNETKKILLNALTTKGVDKSKIIFNKTGSLVQGPAYANDSENISKYEPYQYVIIELK
jgi:WD40 repeat protein